MHRPPLVDPRHLEALCENLEAVAAALDRLIDLGEAKRAALLAQDATKVEQLVRDEEEALSRLEAVEARRASLLQQIPIDADQHEDGVVALERIAVAATGSNGDRLQRAIAENGTRLARLRGLNRVNVGLLRNVLTRTHLLVDALTGESPKGGTYGRGRATAASPPPGSVAVDRRA